MLTVLFYVVALGGRLRRLPRTHQEQNQPVKEEGEDEAEERVGEEAVAEERCRQTGLFSG